MTIIIDKAILSHSNMYGHSDIYVGNIRDKGREYANSDLYWFDPILDLRPVPKLHLRFSIYYPLV